MEEWDNINGSKIERSFLEQNIAEARQLGWSPAQFNDRTAHSHCMICQIAISAGDSCVRSGNRWLCEYCHNRFILSGQRPDPGH